MNALPGPIVIGGIGGSGTRVVAQILKEFNVFIGEDLNEPLDNLSYTLLFKRRKWFYKNHNNQKEIFKGIRILEKSMLHKNPRLTLSEFCFLLKSTFSMYINGHNHLKDGKGKWALQRYRKIIEGCDFDENKYIGWGWKEPNSHLILPYLYEYFPNMKYIHTIRNGLDMAFSSNQQQLYNWATLFNISQPKNSECLPAKSFEYWMKANKSVVDFGRRMGTNRFYLLNFDSLCESPKDEIAKLLVFLELKVCDKILENLYRLPTTPITSGRFENENIDWLEEESMEFLDIFGFYYKKNKATFNK
ncbi:MAG: sulfotransferase [Bacteroidales bacterium]|nr:sulfotransferase [Bacteroidales bacterium]